MEKTNRRMGTAVGKVLLAMLAGWWGGMSSAQGLEWVSTYPYPVTTNCPVLIWHMAANPDYNGNESENHGPEYVIATGVEYTTDSGRAQLVNLEIPRKLGWPILFESTAWATPLTVIRAGAFANRSAIETVVFGDMGIASWGVTNIGNGAFSNCTKMTSCTLPPYYEALEYGGLGHNLLRIGKQCFYKCSSLTNMVIPDGVTSFGSQMFGQCTSLVSVTLGKGITRIPHGTFDGCTALEHVTLRGAISEIDSNAFCNCSTLKSIGLPEGLRNIGDYAFSGCRSLSGIVIPNTVTNIGRHAFQGCTGLVSVVVGSGVRNLPEESFQGCAALESLTLSEGLESIGEYAFSGCSSLTNIVIPSTVTNIGYGAFEGCTNLVSVRLGDGLEEMPEALLPSQFGRLESYATGDGVKSIPEYAFSGCGSLTNVVVGRGVESIGECAFQGCAKLKTVFIPANVAELGAEWSPETSVFWGCTGLEEIRVDAGNAQYASRDGVLYDKGMETLLVCPAGKSGTLEIPDGVVSIGTEAFAGVEGRLAVVMPDSVTEIGEGAFAGSPGLSSVKISGNVPRIGDYTFRACTGLGSVTIPRGVGEIAVAAFEGCTGLESFAVDADNSAFSAKDGVLFNQDGTVLQVYPEGRKAVAYAIPQGVTDIGWYAFNRCPYLKTLVFPASLSHFESSSFNACGNLSAIEVDAGNAVYGSVDGVLFDKSGTVLLLWPQGKTGTPAIPAGTVRIGSGAFAGCTGLASVELPAGLQRIDSRAFAGTGLRTVTVPAGVEAVDSYAFAGCASLTNATVLGGSIGEGAFEECNVLDSVTVGPDVTDIDSYAFYFCHGLETIYAPASWEGTDSPVSQSFYKTMRAMHDCPIVYIEMGSGGGGGEATAMLELGETERVFTADAANGRELAVTANVSWTAESSEPWLTVKTAGGTGNGTVVYDVAENTGTEREGRIHVSGGGLTRTFWVTQEGKTVTWTYTVSGGQATVTGCSQENGVLAIPATLGGCPVTSIGNDAFSYRSGLTGVSIPDSVTNIGSNAFEFCDGLTDVSIPDSVTDIGAQAFCFCQGLTNATIGNSVTNIGNDAFRACSRLGGVTIPDSVIRIGDYAFEFCDGLTSVSIPDSVTSIGKMAFYDCRGLSGVVIGNGVTNIGFKAFSDCPRLASVTIGNGVKSIGEYAFDGCSGLTAVHIHDLAAWCGIAFEDRCANPLYYACHLHLDGEEIAGDLLIPDGVTGIGANAFSGCSNLTGVTIPDSVTNIGDKAFCGCSNLTNVAVGNGVKSIGEEAFYGCSGLATVAVGNGVTSIGYGAFSDCSGLTDLRIPDSVKSIAYWAFSDCSSLTNVAVGIGVTTIGWNAFYGCNGLKTLHVPASWQGTDMLADASVPSGCTVLYDVVPATETSTGVPYAWLEENAASILAANGGDHEAAANAAAANGMPVWQCYVAGLSPADAAAEFKVKSITLVDGEPVLEWSPDLEAARAYTVQGKAAMADAWGVPNASSCFFRVLVEMPE